MIQEHFDMTLADKLTLVSQVLGKVAVNFWPAIVLAVIAGCLIHKQETAGRGYKRRK